MLGKVAETVKVVGKTVVGRTVSFTVTVAVQEFRFPMVIHVTVKVTVTHWIRRPGDGKTIESPGSESEEPASMEALAKQWM